MIQKEFLKIKLADLIPYANNPRDNEEAVADVAESIEQCGDLDPIEVDENNVILSGHTRLKALKRRGETETDIIRYTGLTEEQKKKYRLLANKTGEKAKWNEDLLALELDGLDFEGFDFGFPTEGGAGTGDQCDRGRSTGAGGGRRDPLPARRRMEARPAPAHLRRQHRPENHLETDAGRDRGPLPDRPAL